MADDDVRVPAGWYPDPLGLPQLRWWDNHSWTEHTSDARQPAVQQPQPMRAEAAPRTRLAFADDLPFADDLADLDDSAYGTELPDLIEPGTIGSDLSTASTDTGPLPSRRTLRAQERLETDGDGTRGLVGDGPAYARPRGALESRDVDPAAAAVRYAEAARLDDAPQSLRYDLDERHEDLLGEPSVPRSAFAHASKSDANLIPDSPVEPEPAPQTVYATRRSALAHAPSTSTVPAWILTLLPIYTLLVGMMVLLGGTDASLAPVTLALVVGVPWVAGIVIAFFDHRLLLRHGMHRPAHWLWAALGAPVYLVARLVATVREAGAGFGPVLTYLVLALFMAGAVVAVPGLAMELSPASFSAEAERSVAEDARSLGADLTIDCPETPPLLVQQSFTCRATNDDGESFDVRVSLQRSNGWIDWRVDNWGVFTVGS